MSAGDAESAAVLTPYNGQVRLIRSILKSKGGSLYDKVARPSAAHSTYCLNLPTPRNLLYRAMLPRKQRMSSY